MDNYYWNSKSKTRGLYYNDDYLEFLVKHVWNIHSPVRIIDYGCGYGYLGTKLLPLLPEGCTYTGVDAGRTLIELAKELFRSTSFPTEFLTGNIQSMAFEQKYDLAV